MPRLVRLVLAIAAVLTGLSVGPTRVVAAETVIGFDDQPAGTTISNQYASQGIAFDQKPSGPAELHPFVSAPPSGEAHSPPNVLDVSQKCGSEFPEATLWGRLAAGRSFVSLFVGDVFPSEGFPGSVTLQGFDLGGNPIPGAKETIGFPGLDVATEASIFDSDSNISFFELSGSPLCQVGVDDVRFEALPSVIPPDFGISAPSLGPTLTPGATATVNLGLHRNPTSTGPISFAVSGLPVGVQASVSPNPSSDPDGSSLTLTMTAAANAQAFANVPVTITGNPSPSAGERLRSVTIPISLAGNFDLRAQGLEVTQGIQPEGPLTPSGGETGGRYSGVNLVAHKRTAVRLFADAHGAIGSGIKDVGALLYGFRDGRALPGSPLRPDYGPPPIGGQQVLQSTEEADPAPVLEAERKSEANAYTFTLPTSWTSGNVSLLGRVFQEPGFPEPGRRPECSSPSCLANNSFTENGVAFRPTENVELWTVALQVNGALPAAPGIALAEARLAAPLPEPGWNPFHPDEGFMVMPYQAVIDISDIVNSESNGTNKGSDAAGRVQSWASAMGNPQFATMGIGPSGFRGLTAGGFRATSAITFDPSPGSGGNRPLTGVAHELFHQFGLQHASSECGGGNDGDSDDEGQSGTPWPLKTGETHAGEAAKLREAKDGASGHPFEGFGQLLGIGLNLGSEPYQLIADGVNVDENFDFMSYCSPNIGAGDPGNWVSPINWEAVFHNFAAAGASSSAAHGPRRPPRIRINRGRLRVVGFAGESGFQLASVGPQVGPRLPTGRSDFTLTALGAHGRKLRSVSMAEEAGHQDGEGSLDELSAEIPARGVSKIEVLDKGAVVARRSRPKRPPRVHVVSPRRGAKVGGRHTVLVRWSATDSAHNPLTASVDFSADGGHSWRTIYVGPNRGQASIPGSYLVGSRSALVRVRVNDGFNETVATSGRFTALAAPPLVSITKTPKTLPGDATLQLRGEAFDQRLQALGGKRLRWFDGPFPLGSGATISAGPLPPGKNHLRLVAHGAGGQTATARTTVTVTPLQLPLLQLSIPKHLPRAARKLTIGAQSAVPSSLTIDGHKFDLGAARRKLRISIPPGKPLLLRMAVTAEGVRTPFAAVVRRT